MQSVTLLKLYIVSDGDKKKEKVERLLPGDLNRTQGFKGKETS